MSHVKSRSLPKRSNPRRAVARAAAASPVACEFLENRLMFITTTFDGTSGSDNIVVSIVGNSIRGSVNNAIDDRSDTVFNNIEINGLGGSDTITINSNGNNTVVVNAGTGNDVVRIAHGSGNMDDITDAVTVNGEGDSDTLFLFDQNSGGGIEYLFFSANQVQRIGSQTMTYNTVESVVVNASSAAGDQFHFSSAPAPDVTVNGGSTATDELIFDGTNTESLSINPTATGAGIATYQGATINYNTTDIITNLDVSHVSLVTPSASDALTVGLVGIDQRFTGISGAITLPDVRIAGATDATIDLSSHDTSTSNDSIQFTSTMSGTSLIKVIAGGGATNTMNVNAGSWTVDTDLGINSGNSLDVVADNSSLLTFSGSQSLHRLEIDDNATVKFIGSGTLLTAQQLAVVSGTGNIDLGTGQTALCSLNGSFSIGQNRTLVKKGLGTLIVSAAQAHGANSFLDVQKGTVNLNTDAGSAAARVLSVNATNASVNFGSTQHVAVVATNGNSGQINMSPNGNHVLVTGAVFISDEGTALNLNDNDMIFDYAPGDAAADAAVRTLLHNGRAGGAWSGNGINSASAANNPQHNTTLGFMEVTEYQLVTGLTVFDGQTLDNSALVIKYTYYGDTNFNGVVNFDDYVRTDIGFNTHLSGWVNGDFNDSGGSPNFDDYVLIDTGFNTQGSALRPPSSSIEPRPAPRPVRFR